MLERVVGRGQEHPQLHNLSGMIFIVKTWGQSFKLNSEEHILQ